MSELPDFAKLLSWLWREGTWKEERLCFCLGRFWYMEGLVKATNKKSIAKDVGKWEQVSKGVISQGLDLPKQSG